MASRAEQLLIVVSIREGRHFPKSPRLNLVVQASFDGEQLTTDPLEHVEQPHFSTELAWELDRKLLHQHRLQRTPIKLQCFAVDPINKRRESVGYIILDLRSVQEVELEPRWYPLLSCKYTKQKPALLISMLLEYDRKLQKPSPEKFRAKKAPPRQASPAVMELLPDRLEAVLVPEQGYHQVGPADHCGDMFVLSVTVAFANKLEQLISGAVKLSAEGAEYFFYYSLLRNDITSEPFRNLLSPDFEAECTCVRIRSSEKILHAFLAQQPPLQVHLCCGNRVMGSTDVPLSALSGVSVDLKSKAATVEGVFILQPPKRSKQKVPPLPGDRQPTIGVHVSLRREEVPPQSLVNKSRAAVKSGAQSAASAEQPSQIISPVQRHPVAPFSPRGRRYRSPSPHTESEAESLLEELQRVKEASLADLDALAQSQPADGLAEGEASSLSVSAPKVAVPSSAHHYCFSLELGSLRNLSLTHSIAATLRYTPYKLFCSAGPVMTNPPVELHRNSEVSLPQGYCAFEFATMPQLLMDTFIRAPLVVEVWHRDSSSKDELVGLATVELSPLMTSDRNRRRKTTGDQGRKQTHRDWVPVIGVERPSEKVAELSFTATLEDLGTITAKDVHVSDSSRNEAASPPQASSHPGAHRPAPSSLASAPLGSAPAASRDMLEYQKALELELWKEQQEELFDDELKKRELSLMQGLGEEWTKRNRVKEALLQKKEMEYDQMEEKFHKSVADLEKKEQQLAEAELQTERLKRELQSEYELAQKTLQDTSKRLQQECDHRVALEREKVQLMEEERGRLLKQISDGESRYKVLEKELQRYREQLGVRPEFRLQSDINLLTLEKVELERKLETTTKSKLHYKQQWGRALKELARFKQREQENAMTRLKKQQAELEAMRLRYLATEEKEAVRQDRQELEEIRNELNRLKQQEERLVPAPAPPLAAPSPAPGTTGESGDDHLNRLVEERDTLLRTGVYTQDDRIVAELNRQIQEGLTGLGKL